MKPKYLFLFKLLGYSILLYLLGHRLPYHYALVLMDALNVTDPRYHMPPNLADFLTGSSLTIIPFLSLTASTPKISVIKKAGIFSLGIVAFFLTDFFFIQYIKGAAPLAEGSVVYEIYLCVKWLLPFLLWMVTCSHYLGELFGRSNRQAEA